MVRIRGNHQEAVLDRGDPHRIRIRLKRHGGNRLRTLDASIADIEPGYAIRSRGPVDDLVSVDTVDAVDARDESLRAGCRPVGYPEGTSPHLILPVSAGFLRLEDESGAERMHGHRPRVPGIVGPRQEWCNRPCPLRSAISGPQFEDVRIALDGSVAEERVVESPAYRHAASVPPYALVDPVLSQDRHSSPCGQRHHGTFPGPVVPGEDRLRSGGVDRLDRVVAVRLPGNDLLDVALRVRGPNRVAFVVVRWLHQFLVVEPIPHHREPRYLRRSERRHRGIVDRVGAIGSAVATEDLPVDAFRKPHPVEEERFVVVVAHPLVQQHWRGVAAVGRVEPSPTARSDRIPPYRNEDFSAAALEVQDPQVSVFLGEFGDEAGAAGGTVGPPHRRSTEAVVGRKVGESVEHRAEFVPLVEGVARPVREATDGGRALGGAIG